MNLFAQVFALFLLAASASALCPYECPANKYYNVASNTASCVACTNGASPAGSIDKCACTCNAGYYGVGGTCTQCPSGSTSPAGSTCLADCLCKAGFYGDATIKGGSCTQCPYGGNIAEQTKDQKRATVKSDCACPANTYAETNANNQSTGNCLLCPGNVISSKTVGDTITYTFTTLVSTSPAGSTEIAACNCVANYYGNAKVCSGTKAADATSSPCETSCQSCGTGATLDAQASYTATKFIDCSCPKGYWNEATASVSKTSCTQCTTGYTTSGTGKKALTDCNLCDTNYYGKAVYATTGTVTAPNAGSCTVCPGTAPFAGVLSAQPSVPASASKDTDCACPDNTYGTNAKTGCTACSNAGTLTSKLGSTVSDCQCRAGSYRGAKACIICPVGSTSSAGSTQASQCTCIAGYWGTGSTCTICPTGMTSNAGSTQQSQCTFPACCSGTYRNTNTATANANANKGLCTVCPKYSTWKSETGPDCVCMANTYWSVDSSTGVASCTLCPGNTYDDTNNKWTALAATSSKGSVGKESCLCAANYFGNGASASGTCTGCNDNGTIIAQPSKDTTTLATDCACPAGKWGCNAGTNTSCNTCATGKYSAGNELSTTAASCNMCAKNYYGDATTGCNICPTFTVGSSSKTTTTAKASSGTTTVASCACPVGLYGTVTLTGGCTACPGNASAPANVPQTTQTACSCNAGYYGDAQTGEDVSVSSGTCTTAYNVCNVCPSGTSSTSGTAKKNTDCGCPANKYGGVTVNASGTVIVTCNSCPGNSSAPANVPTTTQSVCNCDSTYYGNGRTCTECTQCPSNQGYNGTIVKQATGDAGNKKTIVTDCGLEVCPKDQYLTQNTSGAYTSTCQKCYTGTPTCVGTTTANAKKDYTECTCAAGYYLDTSTKQCVVCSVGATSLGGASAVGVQSCFCKANYYGTAYKVSTTNGVSTYVATGSSDSEKCTICPGTTSLNTSGSLLAQTPGTSVTQTTPVTAPTVTTAGDCACPENYYGTKSTSCTACPVNSSGPGGNSGVESCMCKTGSYGSAFTASTASPPVYSAGTCTKCESSTVAAQTASTTMKAEDCACLAGYYPSATKGTCDACDTGYTSNSGAAKASGTANKSACNLCNTGYYGLSAGTATSLTGCTVCPTNAVLAAQSSVPTTKSTFSDCKCPIASYADGVSNSATGTCKGCPTGSTTASTGQTSLSSCMCKQNYFGKAYTKDAAGALSESTCTACAGGGTTSSASNTNTPSNCSCPVNYYGTGAATLTFTQACQVCPKDANSQCSTTASNAQTACSCPKGSYWNEKTAATTTAPAVYECKACTAGTTTLQTGSTKIDQCLCMSGYYGDATSSTPADQCKACDFTNSPSTPQKVAGTTGATKKTDCQCPKGYYGDAQGTATEAKGGCKKCPGNSTTSGAGATAVSACQCMENYYGNAAVIGGVCTKCPNGGTVAAGTGTTGNQVSNCMCPANTYGTNAMVGCKACYASYSSSAGASTCSCASGFTVPTDTSCLACIAPAPAPVPTTASPTPGPGQPTHGPTVRPTPGPGEPTFAPTTVPGPAPAPTDASSKASSGSSAGAIVGSICGVLVLGGIGYYFYSQKQALAKQAAENAVTGLDQHNKV